MASAYKEWEPLTHIVGRIPQKYQRGLFSTDVQVSSGDVHKNTVALGTNVPTVYLFDKSTGVLTQTLKCGKSSDRVSAVVIQESVDTVVVAGTEKGLVHIFQLPSSLPGRCKELKQFVLPHLLKKEVTCLCLSVNCLRLFAGDSAGTVISTDIDYDKEECIPEVLLKESAAIVQLSYCRGLLLVATVSQAVLYDVELRTVTKIGSQDRKILGKFGGQLSSGDHKKSDAIVYVSRPGYRLWRCDAAGQVKATLVFKELLDKAPEIQLAVSAGSRLTDQIARGGSSGGSAFVDQFGEMLLLGDSRMVIWNDNAIYIIDVALSTVVGVCRDIGPILHVFAKSADEIFLLRTGMQRRLIRLATSPLGPAMQASLAGDPGATAASDAAAPHVTHGAEVRSHTATAPALQTAGSAAPASAAATLPVPRPLLDSALLDQQEPTNAAKKFKDVESKLQSGLDNMKKGLSNLMKSTAAAAAASSSQQQRRPTVQPQGSHSAESDQLPLHALSSSSSSSGGGSGSRTAPHAITARSVGIGPGAAAEAPIVRSFDDEPELVTRLPVQGPKKLAAVQLSGEQRASVSLSPEAACGMENDLPADNQAATLSLVAADGCTADDNPLCDSTVAPAALAGSPADYDGVPLEQRLPIGVATTAGSYELKLTDPPTVGTPGTGRRVVKAGKEGRKEKKRKAKKVSEVEVAASERFRALYDQLANSLIHDVPTIAYEDYESAAAAAAAEDSAAVEASGAEQQFVGLRSSSSSSGSVGGAAAGVDQPASAGRASVSRSGSDQTLPLLATAASSSSAAVAVEHSVQSESAVSSPTEEPAIYDVYRSADTHDVYSSSPDGHAAAAVGGSDSSIVDKMLKKTAVAPAERVADDSLNSDDGGKDGGRPTRSIWSMISEQWTEYTAPKVIKSIAACSPYISFIDKDDNIHYSRLKDGAALEWRKLDVCASAIALSPSGDLSWRLVSDGTAFAGGCRAQIVSPTQMKWTEAVRGGVTAIAVGDSAAWYIKEGGRLHIHDGVSKDRPLTRSQAVKCDRVLSKVAGRQRSMLLALASDGEIVRYDGTSWHMVPAPPNSHDICDLSVGCDDITWVVDCAGNVWFADPAGALAEAKGSLGRVEVNWWQVNYHLNLAPSHHRKDSGQQPAADKRNKCLVSVADNVVVLSIEPRKTLRIRLGHVVGHQWIPMSFPGIALSASWDMVYTNDSENIWLVQARRELFCYSVSNRRIRTIVMPDCHAAIRNISGSEEALWVLFDDGRVFVSLASHGALPGGSSFSLIGLSWAELDMSQLSEVRLRHVSVGREYVWAVDEFGTVYVRVGSMPKQNRHMSPAWAPIESKLPQMGAHFTSIHVSDDGSAVWAVDSKENVFARRGISHQMPLGLSWVQVIGSPVKNIILTHDTAWALTPDGEVMCRAGMTSVNITGDYWKILPSNHFKHLAVSLGNFVWAIGAEGQVLEHRCKVIGHVAQHRQQHQRDAEPDHDWELV